MPKQFLMEFFLIKDATPNVCCEIFLGKPFKVPHVSLDSLKQNKSLYISHMKLPSTANLTANLVWIPIIWRNCP